MTSLWWWVAVRPVGGNVFGFALRDLISFIVSCLIKLLG